VTDLVTFGGGLLRMATKDDERLETARNFSVGAGGAAAATAVAAQRVGADATWLSKLADSPLGHRVRDGFGGTGIDTEIVWSNAGRQGTYFIERGGEPRGIDVHYRLEDAAFARVAAEEFDPETIRNAEGFYVTGVTPALSDTAREATANLLRAARQSGTTVALGVDYRESVWSREEAHDTLTQMFPAVDTLVVSTNDAEEVLDYGADDPPQMVHRIAADYDFDTVVVTREGRGAIAWHDSVVHEHDGYETDVVDPMGADDALAGAFVARRLHGDDVHDALDYATATAALKRTIPGDVATVSRTEVEAVVERHRDTGTR
jgi:2-dehydro-3-deoxygluconokinase